jgi:hypothetical protein
MRQVVLARGDASIDPQRMENGGIASPALPKREGSNELSYGRALMRALVRVDAVFKLEQVA